MGGESSKTEKIEDVEIDGSMLGYRVLAIQENSPTSKCGLVCYFDFIVHANGARLDTQDDTFVDMIRNAENEELILTVYNAKNKSIREVGFVPNRDWGGSGLLGLTIRFDTYADFDAHLVHILEVNEGSPAEQAGFVPFDDYLLGTAQFVFETLDDLHEIVTSHEDNEIEIYVYSVTSDSVRRTMIKPSNNWNGDGMLGCNVGHGYLHRLPHDATTTIGSSDNGSHYKLLLDPKFVNKCKRFREVSTPIGDGKALVPFPGTENEFSENNTVCYVLLDWDIEATVFAKMNSVKVKDYIPPLPEKPVEDIPDPIPEKPKDLFSTPPPLPPKPASASNSGEMVSAEQTAESSST